MPNGRNDITYYSVTTDYDTPSWIKVACIINEGITDEDVDVAGTCRGERVEDHEQGATTFSASLTYKKKYGTDSVIAAFRNAKDTSTPLDMLFMDNQEESTVSGATGTRSPMRVMSINETRNTDAMDEFAIELQGCIWDWGDGSDRTREYDFVPTP